MYDFANSGYTTVVITAVFSAYFVAGLAKGATWGPFAWTATLGTSYVIVMLTVPLLGAWADRLARKKVLLMATTIACVLSTAALALVPTLHGTAALIAGMVLVALSNTFYGYGESLTGAFLPELATEEGMGRVSGWGWGFGYLGGMLTLGICLAYVLSSQRRGLSPDQFIPGVLLITALMYAAAACVTFFLLPERAEPKSAAGSKTSVWRVFLSVAEFPDVMWLLLSTVFFQAGVAVAITVSAIYAQQVIGFEPSETMLLVFLLNIAAAAGAMGSGYGRRGFGVKASLVTSLIAWVIVCAGAASVTSKPAFWAVAALAGVAMGSSQSLGRAMVGVLTPAARSGEFFALWAISTRMASILGPMSYGTIVWMTAGDQRMALWATASFFAAGLALLLPIQMKRT